MVKANQASMITALSTRFNCSLPAAISFEYGYALFESIKAAVKSVLSILQLTQFVIASDLRWIPRANRAGGR